MSISKEMRAEAMTLLSAVGSRRFPDEVTESQRLNYATTITSMGEALECDLKVVQLAREVLGAVPGGNDHLDSYEGSCLEAEALLRDGWEPGDDVEVYPTVTVVLRPTDN